MVTTRDSIRHILDKLPDNCSMDEFLDQLFYINLIDKRLDEAERPDATSFTTDQVREKIAQWRAN